MSPAQSRPGQAVTFVIKVSNPGAAQLQGSTAIFSLFADGQKISESPRLAFAPPNQACVEWPTTLPMKGQTVEVKAVVLGNNALNGAAAKVSMSFAARVR